MNVTRWQRLKSLYGEVMDLTGSRRRAYLAGIANSSAASDLDRLLSRESELEGFLEEPAWASQDLEHTGTPLVLASGDVVSNRFEIDQFLGAGGMGEVYKAFDRDMQLWVALKTLRAGIASQPLLVTRLRKEVQLARRITHPNICRLYDAGRAAADGGRELVFFTMELLEGHTLSDAVRQQPFTPEQAIPIAYQLVAGLTAAHQAGIIHRDFKSGNVFLVRESGAETRVVITDFGLASEIDPSIRETLSAFGSTAPVGTPAYMAPELLEGRPVTTAVDIYSLGVVLFEMLTGRLPFEGSSPLVIALRRLREPSPDIRHYVPNVPDTWSGAIAACLERDPQRRPPNGSEVGRLLSGESVPVRRISRRWIVGGLGTATAAAGAAQFIRGRLSSSKAWDAEAKRHVELGQEFAKRRTKVDLDNALKEYQSAVRLEPSFPDAWTGLADAYSAMANFNFMQPREGLDKARNAAASAVRLNPSSGNAQGVLGYVISIDVRRWMQAEPYFQKAVQLDPKSPLVRLWYAAWLGKRGKPEAAIRHLNKGLESEPASFLLHHQMAGEYFRAKRLREFLAEAGELLRLQPYEASAHLMYARALEWMGRFDEALASCAEAEKYGDTPVAMCNRGCVEAARGNTARATILSAQVHEHWTKNPFQTLLLAQLLSRLRGAQDVMEVLLAGYDRDDSTVLGAPTSPYLEKWQLERVFREFNRKIGFTA